MKHFKLYFEFYGKYFTTTVEANSECEAKEKVRDKVKFVSKPKESFKTEEEDFGKYLWNFINNGTK